jgi:hypothetical protein
MSHTQQLGQPVRVIRAGYDAPKGDRRPIVIPPLPQSIVARLPRTASHSTEN